MDVLHERNEMPVQNADIRRKNFFEVALGYSAQQAVSEAKRCLQCKSRPCVGGCPVYVDIPSFIGESAKGNFEEAYRIISRTNSLSAVCGRVCPQESQCECRCMRASKGGPLAIGRLERFVADYHNAHSTENPQKCASNGHKVAVVGSGPSGLTCAGDLAKRGYEVTVYEALHVPGGVLSYGIPEFRLPKAIVRKEIEQLEQLGVIIETNIIIGKTVTVNELFENFGFRAVFVGSGAGLPNFLGIPGENFKGVYSANEFLTRINLMKAYQESSATLIQKGKNVVVVGGGNEAIDAARCARRLGAEVSVVYRSTEKEMPARAEEAEFAREEGVKFMFLTAPTAINGSKDGRVCSVRCQEMIMCSDGGSGRVRSVPLYDSEFIVDADCVIIAIGTTPNQLIVSSTKGLRSRDWGGIIIDAATGATSLKGIFAGGDAITGTATVIQAMGAGKTAASAIDRYIMNGESIWE